MDRLTKSAHFIPIQVIYNAKKFTKIYIHEIVQLYGVPIFIIFYKCTQFNSNFWRTFQTEFGTRLDLSTIFRPQIDGQFEWTIYMLEDMLHACVIDLGDH